MLKLQIHALSLADSISWSNLVSHWMCSNCKCISNADRAVLEEQNGLQMMQECFIIQKWGTKILVGREYTQFKDTTRRHAHTHTHTQTQTHTLASQSRTPRASSSDAVELVADLAAVLPPSVVAQAKQVSADPSASVANPKTTEFNHISFEIKTSALFCSRMSFKWSQLKFK